jgi:transcriptional regulator with GAF, ATPase, and Fis domain
MTTVLSSARGFMELGHEATSVTRLKAATEYQKATLSVIEGPDAGLKRELTSRGVRIGTSTDNSLVLTDGTVSRRHCEINLNSDGIRVVDLGSTNGVMSGSQRIYDANITGTALLRLGCTQLLVTPVGNRNETKPGAERTSFGKVIGRSAKMLDLFGSLEQIARAEFSVLIEGETGTGKELVAESIHAASQRANGPFVVFDCSAVAASLAESEIFGHERGAFTGASTLRQGLFEQADGGTIFLDELGELPQALQPKLLRVLEKREVRRLGGSKTLPINVRVICATNRNLREEVKKGHFREDLFYRLAGAQVYVPPLRERLDDLPLLANQFLQASTSGATFGDIPQEVWEIFEAYRWPGNVREFKNAILRVLVAPEKAVDWDNTFAVSNPAPAAPSITAPLPVARRACIDAFERSYLQRILAQTGGNMARAAALAQVSRQSIHTLVIKHGLR